MAGLQGWAGWREAGQGYLYSLSKLLWVNSAHLANSEMSIESCIPFPSGLWEAQKYDGIDSLPFAPIVQHLEIHSLPLLMEALFGLSW